MWDSLQQQLQKTFEIGEISGTQWRFANSFPPLLVAVVLIAALVFAVWSYRREGTKGRPMLVALRLLVFILLLIVFLQPSLSLQYEQEGESRVALVLDQSQSMLIEDGGANKETRWRRVIDAVDGTKEGLIDRLEDHEIEIFTVADGVTVSSRDALKSEKPEASSTGLGTALDELKGEDLTGVVVLSDMAWNTGDDPVDVANRFGRRGIPVYPIPVGKSDSPDASITSLHIRSRVFPGEEIPLKVQVYVSPELVGETTDLVARLDDEEVERMSVTLEEGLQTIEMPLTKTKKRSGQTKLSVTLEPIEKEISKTNNQQDHSITFIAEKVKVLYVEGAPRWEYRYLRTVLLRDPRLDIKFLMTAGDPDLAKHSAEYVSSFPAKGKSEFDFDLVIIGDVAATYFEEQQMEWMVQQVSRLGGTLLMLGGSVAAPQSYANTPLEALLPVAIEGKKWKTVTDDLIPSPTGEGFAGRIASLGVDESKSRRLWGQLAPMHDIPDVSAKPGATVLVTVGRKRIEGRPYPLVAWHRFGTGKAMFVGTELLWRLRKTTGRQYHERFWSTAIQFMAVSRLLGGNKRINLEADQSRFATGEPVRLHADVLDEYLEPVDADSFAVEVRKEGSSESAQVVTLRPAIGAKGFYQGYYLPPIAGSYEVLATDKNEKLANTFRFSVVDESMELRRPTARFDVAEQIATQSGGKVISIDDLDQLHKLIETRRPVYQRETTIRLWNHPVLYVVLLLVAGSEWWLRRRNQLV